MDISNAQLTLKLEMPPRLGYDHALFRCAEYLLHERILVMALIFKITPQALCREVEAAGCFRGAPIDITDGFIHFSTQEQLAETATKHFAGQTGLLLVAVDEARLGDKLVYEPSRGGALFPHLYGPLPLDAVRWIAPLPLGPDGMLVVKLY